MSNSVEDAYQKGKLAYKSGGIFEDCPDELSDTEKELWQVGFDEACFDEIEQNYED
jgi:hypothetical protein